MDYSQFPLSKPGARKRPKNHSRRTRTEELRDMEVELDALLSAHVVERDKICVWCGKDDGRKLYSAHILPKGSTGRLRFEPYNLMALCFPCHLGPRGWHKSPLQAHEWFEKKYPGRYERLQIAERCAPKVDLKLLLTVWRKQS